MNRILVLFLLVSFLVQSLLLVCPISAQSIPAPSAPEFTLKIESYPYYELAKTYSYTDPSTGETITSTGIGYRDNNQTITITVANPPRTLGLNDTYRLIYNVRVKEGNDSEWRDPFYGSPMTVSVNDKEVYSENHFFGNYPGGSRVAVEIEAILQNNSRIFVDWHPSFFANVQTEYFGWRDNWVSLASSGWSSTQTLKVPADIPLGPSPSPQLETLPSGTPSSFSQLSWLIISVLVFGVVAVIVVLMLIIALIDGRLRVLEKKQNDT